MDFGSLCIEGRKVRFVQGARERSILGRDIAWAYQREDAVSEIVFYTRLKEKYQFEMPKEQAQACLEALKRLNPRLMVSRSQEGGRLPLNSLDNTRDLGMIQTRDGKYILPGCLLRSGDLYHASYGDQEYLRKTYDLKQVIDFRMDRERKVRPDMVIYGVDYTSLPVLDEKSAEIIWEEDMLHFFAHFQGDGEAYMMQLYENLALNRRAQKIYGDFFRLLKRHSEGAALWHCGVGKDRAGMASALLLYILGVPLSAILEDYVCSNMCLQSDAQAALRMLETRGLPRRALKNAEIMFGAKEIYLQHAFDRILEKYGTVDKYIKKAVGLTAFDMNFLKDRYLL